MSVSHGKPYAGKLHVRFDEGAGVPGEGRSALLYSTLCVACPVRFQEIRLSEKSPSPYHNFR